jgi:hypothetical protein
MDFDISVNCSNVAQNINDIRRYFLDIEFREIDISIYIIQTVGLIDGIVVSVLYFGLAGIDRTNGYKPEGEKSEAPIGILM